MTARQDPRAGYIAGLRTLADLLEHNAAVPLPYGAGADGRYDADKMTFYCDSKDQIVAFVKAVPGKLDKRTDDSLHYGFELHGAIHGLYLYAAVRRDEVCERVVTGTRQVTTLVPAPDAPMIEVTKTVEDVEWVCSPLLAESVSA